MKKSVLIALLSVAAIGTQAGVITLGSTWTPYTNGDSAPTLSNQSSTGLQIQTAALSSSANRSAYQTGLIGGAFAVGDTAILSFTVTGNDSVASKNLGFQFEIWDSVAKDGFSSKVDYGPHAGTAGNLWRVGADRSAAFDRVGTDGENRVNTDDTTAGPALDNASADFVMTVVRDTANSYSLTVLWGTESLSTTVNDPLFGGDLTHIDSIGFRMNSKDATDLTISGINLSVIPEPATLGLISMVGAGILFVRRRFAM